MKTLWGVMACFAFGLNLFPAMAQRLQPEDLEYLGAFSLPEGSNGSDWSYSGYAMAYYPEGDPDGPADGFPGSLFAIGHDHHQYISEISIPVPIISPQKKVAELNTGGTLQTFHDITHGMFGELEIPRAGLAYLGPQGSQTTGKLYFCWGQHFQFELVPSHGWCEVDLSNPQTAGPWFFGNYTNFITNDYMFEVPAKWARQYAAGMRLATGRFRDGGWGGQGPTLFAFAPWLDGNPPAPNDTLRHVLPLLLYGEHVAGVAEIANSDEMRMKFYSPADEWSGGAWLSSGEKSAVIFVGTKAMGNAWYGFSDGTVWPEQPPYPPVPPFPHDNRGWWSDSIQAQIIFYDPEDLAKVAGGSWHSYDPQPYAVLSIDGLLFDPGYHHERYKRYLVGAASFDREHGLLYVVERRADAEDKSIIHVWRLAGGPTGVKSGAAPGIFKLWQNHPNPFNPVTTIAYSLVRRTTVALDIYDARGRRIRTLVHAVQAEGEYRLRWDGRDELGMPVAPGLYFCRLRAGAATQIRKMMVLN